MSMRSKKNRWREIALAVRAGVPHLERVAEGIRRYAKERGNWRFLVNPEAHDLPPASLKGWKGDGVIALCNTAADQRVLRNLKCPVVNISGARKHSAFPRVRNDYREIGRRGAAYLRDRGFRRFGFYGVSGLWYSEEVEAGVESFARANGIRLDRLHADNPMEGIPRWNRGQEELENWLRRLRPPFAVMAAHDPRAAIVIRACERIGLRVPDQVAVLGVNDDTVTCESCHPPLTSIDRNGFEVGWRAAQTLDRMMRGRPAPAECVIAPGDIRERESTNALAVERPELAEVLRFVEARHREPIGVDQMAEACGKSRRWLEAAFRRELNCSPSAFLERRRVQAVIERMNREPAAGLGELARACGLSGTRQLHAAFKRVRGASARDYLAELKRGG